MKRRCLYILICLLTLFTGVHTVSLPVSAAGDGSVTVLFRHEERPVPDAEFQIYRAGLWDGNEYRLIAPFSDYSVPAPDDPNSDTWKTLASTLAAYAARDQIKPLGESATDEEGQALFEGLEDGLYLVTGSMTRWEDLLLFPQAMLVNVPFTKADGTVDYEVVTEPKYDYRKQSEETVRLSALKIWKDDGNEAKRPADITVQLLRDGKVYEEKVLNEANNWRYTWENLDSAHDWLLTEKDVPEDYTVQVSRDGTTFTATNTNGNPPPPPPPELPQTGLVWWPVPLMAGAGVVLIFTGICLLMRKRRDLDE